MKRLKRFRNLDLVLILVILIIGIFLVGCCCSTCPSTNENCFLVIYAGYNVWGGVYVDGQYTGEWIDFLGIEGNKSVTINVPCGKTIEVKIVDGCGYESHIEIVNTYFGHNDLFFSYWKDIDKSNDVHCRCSL